MATVTVHNLDSYDEHVYVDLTPAEAVRNAYAQYQMKDFNAAGYESRYPISMVEIRPTKPSGKKTVYALGHFAAVA